MSRVRTIGYASLAVAVVTSATLGPHWLWDLQAPRPIEVVIVDKTVPFQNYREHENFVWLLHNWKMPDRSGRFAHSATDYVGFDPTNKVGHDLRAEDLGSADVLFVADTYGVYVGDYEVPGDVAALERSPLIYGGFTSTEADAVKRFAARGGLVIGEFNTFASPTADEPRQILEQVHGLKWTKWVGRYWPDLQDKNEVPPWLGEVYERLYGRPFDIQGAAFVFVRDDAEMVILRRDVHLESEILTLHRTDAAPELTGLPQSGAFWYWLDLLEARGAEVIYEYRLDVTPEGRRALETAGLPERFPAVLRHGPKKNVWYLAGDFVDTPVELGPARRWGLLTLRRWRSAIIGGGSGEQLMWGWYAPLLEKILLSRSSTSAVEAVALR